MHPMLREALGDYCSPQDTLLLGTHLIQGKAAMASNGSLLNQSCASHGWKLHSRVSKAQASGHGIVSSGRGLKMSLLRPEAGGFLATMVAMDVLLSTGPRSEKRMDRPEQTRVLVYIDEKSLILNKKLETQGTLGDSLSWLWSDHVFKVVSCEISSRWRDGIQWFTMGSHVECGLWCPCCISLNVYQV